MEHLAKPPTHVSKPLGSIPISWLLRLCLDTARDGELTPPAS